MAKGILTVALFLVVAFFTLNCGCLEETDTTVDETNPEVEHWDLDIDNETGYGTTVMTKDADGVISVEADWVFIWGSDLVYLNFTDGALVLDGNQSTMTADGTAFYTGAPGGYTSSAFHLVSEGMVSDGSGYDDYVITFTTEYWPPEISGHVTLTRTSGSGVTP